MKIYFLGAGALGCAIGGTLAAGGSDVTLIDRYQAHVDAINRDGLRMKEGETERVVRVKAATDCTRPAARRPRDRAGQVVPHARRDHVGAAHRRRATRR